MLKRTIGNGEMSCEQLERCCFSTAPNLLCFEVSDYKEIVVEYEEERKVDWK